MKAIYLSRIRNLVEDLLLSAGIEEPPLNPIKIANVKQLNVEFLELSSLTRGMTDDLSGTIRINAGDSQEVQNYTLAREIGMALKPPELARIPTKSFVSEFASELLLPTTWFETTGNACNWDLGMLKETFCTAGWDTIVRKTLKHHSCLITIIDGGIPSFRRASRGIRFPKQLMPAENQLYETIRESGQPDESYGDNCVIRGWSTQETDQLRIVLVTETGDEY